MSEISFNLVVLRSADMSRSVAFYNRLGMRLEQHRHGTGPEHFSAELAGGGVFEIYPATPNGPSTLGTRIGFRVPSVDAARPPSEIIPAFSPPPKTRNGAAGP
jgi:catechol 2,3-dioxygenase-like lactoylglutathione lyase family enzyme